ncbi:MAG: Rrf2 family transcriptional regulator [Spirochaetales bacterium]|nr:Rrf2 family transcriptional regulator [Spirochaetales bacterium]
MNISTKTRYGFRLMIYLGKNQTDQKSVQISEIAEKEEISLKYLEKIVQMLKRSGLVSVKRGPNGGYRIAQPLSSITLLSIFESLEGSCSVIDCLDTNSCDRIGECSTISLWQGLSDTIRQYLEGQTLEELIQKGESGKDMFYI